MKDSLKKWYKSGFDNLRVITPIKVWSNIEDSIKMWPSNWYKTNAKEIHSQVPKGVWNEISAKMQVSNQIKKNARFFIYRSVSIILGFAMIPFTTVNYFSLELKELNKTVQSSNSSNKESELSDNNYFVREEEPVSTLNYRIAQRTPVTLDSDTNNHSENDYHDHRLETSISVSSMNARTLNKFGNNIERELAHYSSNNNNRKFYVGGIVKGSFTSLISPLTRSIISSKSSLDGKLGSNISYGLSMNYDINYKNSICANLLFNDHKAFTIIDLNSPEDIRNKTSFNFITISASYKRNLLNNSANNRLNTGIGIFASSRIDFSEHSDVSNELRLSNYRKVDLGLDFSFGYSYNFANRWRLTTDLDYQIGVLNLFKGSAKVPASFYRVNSSSIGIRIGLMYCIK